MKDDDRKKDRQTQGLIQDKKLWEMTFNMEDDLLSLNRELQETNKNLQAAYQWMRDSRDLLRESRYEECFGFLVDCEGKIELISEKVLEYTGKSRNELIARNIEDLIQPSSRDHFRHALRQAWIGILDPIDVRGWGQRVHG